MPYTEIDHRAVNNPNASLEKYVTVSVVYTLLHKVIRHQHSLNVFYKRYAAETSLER